MWRGFAKKWFMKHFQAVYQNNVHSKFFNIQVLPLIWKEQQKQQTTAMMLLLPFAYGTHYFIAIWHKYYILFLIIPYTNIPPLFKGVRRQCEILLKLWEYVISLLAVFNEKWTQYIGNNWKFNFKWHKKKID